MQPIKQTISVEEIEEKEWNNRTFYVIKGIHKDSDTAWQGTIWSATLKDRIRTGEDNLLEFTETEKNGYTNRKITNVANSDGSFPASSSSGGGGRVAKADPAKTESIERQVAAKEAVQLIVGGKAELDDFDDTAQMVLNFIKGK